MTTRKSQSATPVQPNRNPGIEESRAEQSFKQPLKDGTTNSAMFPSAIQGTPFDILPFRNVVAEIEDTEGLTTANGIAQLRHQLEPLVGTILSNSVLPIIQRESKAAVQSMGLEMRDAMLNNIRSFIQKEVFEEVSRHVPIAQSIQIVRHRKRPQRIQPPFHALLPTIIKMASARPDGFSLPLWLYGPKGVGKTRLSGQVAQAFGVQFYLIPLSPTTTEGKLLGFKNAATGDFVTGLLNEPYARGGLALLDEVDVADPGVLVGINALLSGREFRFPNGEVIKRHPDFYIFASGNTSGGGADNGYVRRKMDAAVLDRFVRIHVGLDPELEAEVCGNKKWAAYITKVRTFLEQNGVRNFELSPRATIHGAALLEAGLEPVQVVTHIFAGAGESLIQKILTQVGTFLP